PAAADEPRGPAESAAAAETAHRNQQAPPPVAPFDEDGLYGALDSLQSLIDGLGQVESDAESGSMIDENAGSPRAGVSSPGHGEHRTVIAAVSPATADTPNRGEDTDRAQP